MANSNQKPINVNLDEINETTGFKRAEEYVWDTFEKNLLAQHGDADVDGWVDEFCDQAEQDGIRFDKIFAKSVCVLGIYAGPRDEFQQRSGSGKAIYPNRDRYDGEFFEGKKHGSGQYTFVSKGKSECDKLVEKEIKKKYGDNPKKVSKDNVTAIAEELQMSPHIVSAIIEYGYHPCYKGDYVRGKRTGQGIMKNKDATIYKGEFLDNKRHGQGVFYYINGDIFSGNWKNGFKHGYGTYHFAQGGEYRGEWVKGIFTQGQWILPDGTYYEGKFDEKNRPCDAAASMHYPNIHMAQNGVFKRGVWAPTSELMISEEVPVDGMAWAD
ncbi:hypothetical protein STCU_02527 [Strigomonas culicis]|uniref:MORN repeat-containing protein n=1 Tax=Strigomonas culicis TaxID=28005 RepID=S9UVU8_9TRYP|nr:hypothetical protein STCU_03811 [Strigomonas culicis]EPY31650.1 hypothetical protein STCU_03349 [Strigomonas culicis]EPY33023.1 hypothetical protein STCU_02527 [Strigomonas culicis]|eukprot:EPY30892.1 hypothetical protein STCU_03811 [Strigomonas culicis]